MKKSEVKKIEEYWNELAYEEQIIINNFDDSQIKEGGVIIFYGKILSDSLDIPAFAENTVLSISKKEICFTISEWEVDDILSYFKGNIIKLFN